MNAHDIIDKWPSRADLAADCKVSVMTVHTWWKRNAISARSDVRMIEGARRRGIALTFEDLARARCDVDDEAQGGEDLETEAA